jgi:hypothetical protein
MTVRFRAGDPNGVPSGYEGNSAPNTVTIPSCGIEDVDRALFKCLRDEVAFQVSDNGGGNQRAVPIVFAVGEKWSMFKSGRAVRDKDNTLILPLVTVRRTSVEQTSGDMTSRGMNQHVGEIIVKTKLDSSDRAYQNLINKLGIPNSDDVPGPRIYTSGEALTTDRDNTLANAHDVDVMNGALLAPKLGVNVWQIITIPTPQFFTAVYEVTIWAQYTEHMNFMLEKLMSSYLPTGNRTLRLDTPKGYWFVAQVDEGFTSEDNSDNTTGLELLRKNKFTVRVPGYLVLSDAPGVPPGIRKFVSAPQITFALGGETIDTALTNGVPLSGADPYEAADDPERQYLLNDPAQHPSIKNALVAMRTQVDIVTNPFTGRREPMYARVVQRNPATGETVVSPDVAAGLYIVSPK